MAPRASTTGTSQTSTSTGPKPGRLSESRRRTISAECDELAAGAAILRHRITMGRYAGHQAGADSGYAVCALLETLATDRTSRRRRRPAAASRRPAGRASARGTAGAGAGGITRTGGGWAGGENGRRFTVPVMGDTPIFDELAGRWHTAQAPGTVDPRPAVAPSKAGMATSRSGARVLSFQRGTGGPRHARRGD